MPDLIGLVLAFALGVVLSAFAVSFARFRKRRARRSSAGAAALLLPDIVPVRSISDLLGNRLRVTLAGVEYVLPVLPNRESREWLDGMDGRAMATLDRIEDAGDDGPAIVAMLVEHQSTYLDALLAYDATGALDHDLVRADATPGEILTAVVEVWRAANPLAVTVASTSLQIRGDSYGPRSSAPRSTDGDPTMSTSSSHPSSSSPTSTPQSTVSEPTERQTSDSSSRASEPERSSLTAADSAATSAGPLSPQPGAPR